MDFYIKIQEEREEAREEGVMSERISVIRKLLLHMSEEEIISCMGYSTEDIEMAKTAQ